MWSPTHIQVTVQKAKGLLSKGKNGTNNCFVTIALGKEKYQTSVKEKATENVDWHEECELTIPDKGNRAELVLTCLHRNNLGIDEFLGQVTLPLNEMDVYDRPRSKWHKLESKPGKEKKKERGELEVRITFIVKSGSLTDLSKKEKHKSSIGQLATSVGGSLLSLGTLEKRKGIKKFAKSLGSKMHITGKSKKGKGSDSDSFNGSFASIGTPNSTGHKRIGQTIGDADPGVISEDEDEFVFDNLSHKSSGSSLNIRGTYNNNLPPPVPNKDDSSIILSSDKIHTPSKPPRIPNEPKRDEWEAKLYGKNLDIGSTDSLKRRSWEPSRVPLPTKEENTPEIIEEKNDKVIAEPDIIQSNTAPSSPMMETKIEEHPKHSTEKVTKNEVIRPQPLPRSNTFACLADKNVHKEKEKIEKSEKKRFGKLKYFRREKPDTEEIISPRQFGERIIIGHENVLIKNGGPQPEISKELLTKYEGKSREEMILIASSMENEATIQRQRVKELEDYLDDLLLRVMETHPKILQNPYTRTTSTKRFFSG